MGCSDNGPKPCCQVSGTKQSTAAAASPVPSVPRAERATRSSTGHRAEFPFARGVDRAGREKGVRAATISAAARGQSTPLRREKRPSAASESCHIVARRIDSIAAAIFTPGWSLRPQLPATHREPSRSLGRAQLDHFIARLGAEAIRQHRAVSSPSGNSSR